MSCSCPEIYIKIHQDMLLGWIITLLPMLLIQILHYAIKEIPREHSMIEMIDLIYGNGVGDEPVERKSKEMMMYITPTHSMDSIGDSMDSIGDSVGVSTTRRRKRILKIKTS